MQYIEVNKHLDITPDDLYAIAVDIQQGKASGLFPIEWKLINKKDLYEDLSYDADTARDHLDDTVNGVRDLRKLLDILYAKLDTANLPDQSIHSEVEDIIKYCDLVIPHATKARSKVVEINLAIDPEYAFADLTYSPLS